MLVRKLFAVSMVAAFCLSTALVLGGCETMKGAGEDIEDAGDAVQDATSFAPGQNPMLKGNLSWASYC